MWNILQFLMFCFFFKIRIQNLVFLFLFTVWALWFPKSKSIKWRQSLILFATTWLGTRSNWGTSHPSLLRPSSANSHSQHSHWLPTVRRQTRIGSLMNTFRWRARCKLICLKLIIIWPISVLFLFAVCKTIVGRLSAAVAQGSDVGVQLEALDILCDLLSRWDDSD